MNTANLKRIPRLNDMAIPPEARIDGGPPCPSPGTRDRATLVIIRQTRARAAEIIFSGRTLGADEALALGLVSRVVTPGTAVEEALALGAAIGGGNAHAVELTKRLLIQAENGDLATTHALELVYCHTCQAGEEVPRAREKFRAMAAARAAAKAKG